MIQVTKVWWDGEKLMAEPIDPAAIYKEPEQPAQQEPLFSDRVLEMAKSALAQQPAAVREDWGPGPHECHSLPAPGRAHYEDGDVFERIAARNRKPSGAAAIAQQQEPVSIVDAEFMRKVLSVAIAGLYEHYTDDVLRVFTLDDLQTVVDLSESLRPQQVEDIYKHAWDMLSAPQPTQPQQEPVAWMDGYRNIYSLEEKAAGCEDAVIPLVPAILQHWSDCAVHNEPAYPAGKCDCGGYTSPPTLSLAQRKPMTIQPIIKDDCGVLRFKKNGLVDALYEHGVKTGFGLNELHCMEFSNEDRQQFAQLIGYSVSGYGDLSYVTDEAYEAAAEAAHGIKE